jgi:hypothetical protein
MYIIAALTYIRLSGDLILQEFQETFDRLEGVNIQ